MEFCLGGISKAEVRSEQPQRARDDMHAEQERGSARD